MTSSVYPRRFRISTRGSAPWWYSMTISAGGQVIEEAFVLEHRILAALAVHFEQIGPARDVGDHERNSMVFTRRI
jgi:hypothetical protein